MALPYEKFGLEQLFAQTAFDWAALLELNDIDASNGLPSYSIAPSPSFNDPRVNEFSTSPQIHQSNGPAQIGSLTNCSSPHKSDGDPERQLRRKLQNREA